MTVTRSEVNAPYVKAYPDTIAPTADRRDIIVRLLARLYRIANGVALLHNEDDTDYGRIRRGQALGPRHAQVVAGATHSYCRYPLDILGEHILEANQGQSP